MVLIQFRQELLPKRIQGKLSQMDMAQRKVGKGTHKCRRVPQRRVLAVQIFLHSVQCFFCLATVIVVFSHGNVPQTLLGKGLDVVKRAAGLKDTVQKRHHMAGKTILWFLRLGLRRDCASGDQPAFSEAFRPGKLSGGGPFLHRPNRHAKTLGAFLRGFIHIPQFRHLLELNCPYQGRDHYTTDVFKKKVLCLLQQRKFCDKL